MNFPSPAKRVSFRPGCDSEAGRFEALLVDLAFGPHEQASVLVVVGDEAVDVSLQLFNTLKDAPLRDWALRMENQISIWLSHEV